MPVQEEQPNAARTFRPPPPIVPPNVLVPEDTLQVKKTDTITLNLKNDAQVKDLILEAILRKAGYAGATVEKQSILFAVDPDGNVTGLVAEIEVEPLSPTIKRSVGHAANAIAEMPNAPAPIPDHFAGMTPAERAAAALQKRRRVAEVEAQRVASAADAINREGEDPEFQGRRDSAPD